MEHNLGTSSKSQAEDGHVGMRVMDDRTREPHAVQGKMLLAGHLSVDRLPDENSEQSKINPKIFREGGGSPASA